MRVGCLSSWIPDAVARMNMMLWITGTRRFFPVLADFSYVLHRNEVFHAFLVQKPFGLQLAVVGDPHREPHQFLSLAWSAHLLSC